MMIDTMLVHQPSSCSMLRLMLGSLLAVGKSAWLGPSRDGREGKRRSSYRLCCHFLGSGHPPNNDSCTTMAMAAGPPLNTASCSDAPSQSSSSSLVDDNPCWGGPTWLFTACLGIIHVEYYCSILFRSWAIIVLSWDTPPTCDRSCYTISRYKLHRRLKTSCDELAEHLVNLSRKCDHGRDTSTTTACATSDIYG